ncbi:MAG: choice-of-anchor D domain-containing protein [Flavobacterium sp.]
MFKKRFFLAIALAGMTIAGAVSTNLLSNFSVAATAVECTGGGSESFTNIPASSSAYATRTWTGDNSVAWSATDARTDQTLTGKAIALRTSTLKNTSTVSGGVGTLSFKYKRVFTGNSTLKVYVNGVQYGGDISVSSETAATFSYAVNVSGNATIELRNSLNRIIVDDIAWTCYSAPVSGPEIQIANAGGTNFDCGSLDIDFGSQSVGVYNDAVFTVKNLGTTALNVSSVSLSNTDDFTVISPAGAFSVAASGSAIVLVRFEATSAGEKTSTLTLNSDDTNEAECIVNLTGLGLAPCVAPEVLEGIVGIDSITAATAEVYVTGVTADNYLAVLSANDSLTALPVDTTAYAVGDSIGGGIVAYNGNDASFTLADLAENTDYYLFVFAYNSVDCTEGPKYAEGVTGEFSTPIAPCIGGGETFTNMPANSSAYATRTWTGDNGLGWIATDARTDQTLTGRAIALRTGTLENTIPATGGIGTLSFKYKRVFTGNSTLKVFVNGVQYGGDISVSADTETVFTEVIDIAGPVTVEIQNTGNRTIIDDVTWNCYSVPTTAELQLLDENNAPQACGYTIDFGIVKINTDKTATFTIKNQGTVALDINALTLNDTINYSIVSPEVIPFTVDSLGMQEVTIRFNSPDIAAHPATLTIESTDADEATCVINLTADAQDVCVAPDDAEGAILVSNETVEGADVEINGITASGYVVVASAGGTVTAPVNGTGYEAGDALGDGIVVYAGTANVFTVEGLDAGTTYSLFVFAYNNSKCIEGPVYSAGLEDELSTLEGPCGGAESFTNMPANASSYATRNWTGDNGITWTATDARTDQTMTGRAIAVRVGKVENTSVITGGIGTLSFSYARIFTNNSVIKVFVNNVQYGADIIVSSDTPAVYSETINVSGNATIRIENSGNRSIIDNIAWTCYSGTGRPAQMLNSKAVEEGVKLYPNPTDGRFNIALTEGNESAQVEVFNTMGKLVLSKKVAANEPVDISNAGKGIYMVNVTAGGKTTSKTIIVK